MASVLEVRDLHKTYRSLRGRSSVALDGLDLHVDGPGVFGLLGPNGSGKTTAIRCVLGLVHPTAGEVRIFDTDVSQLQSVADRVGALVEGPKFAPTMSGRRNLELLASMGGVSRARVHEVLELVELTERADDPVSGYSLGMGQRLGIAAALLRDPQLVILDEPTNGLDPAGIADVRRLVRRLADEGRTVLLSSHQLHEVQQVCDRAIVLRKGVAIASGTVDELIGSRASTRVVVTVDDRPHALEMMAEAGLSAMPALDPRQFVVQLTGATTAADVNRHLALRGIYATELRADSVTLEDAFLSLTIEPNHPTTNPEVESFT